jgi:hypothetical protein
VRAAGGVTGSVSELRMRIGVDAVLAAFAGWTVGYQVGFMVGLPAYADAIFGLALAAIAIVVLWRLKPREATDGEDRGASHGLLAVCIVLVLGVALGVLSTFMNRPDADDITFFHRAAAQLSHLGAPILTHDTTSDVADLPGPMTGYLLTSYEFLCALAARVFGLNPLSMYQNGGAAVSSALVPPVYYVLLRRLGLRPLVAVAAVGGVVAFLLLDGNDHHAMGNFAFVRLWQGKAILLTVLTPYMLSAVIGYLDAPGRRDWMCLLCAGIAATGLSTIGCFFAPAYLAVATLAVCGGLLAARACPWRSLVRRWLLMNATSVYPLVILLAVLFVPFPGTVSPSNWSRAARASSADLPIGAAVEGSWVRQLLWPASGVARFAWALCLVLVGPFLALTRQRALCVAMFVPMFALLIANPLAGTVLFRAVPEVFWRFYFVLPIPLCFGLVFAGLVSVPTPLLRRGRGLLTVSVVAGFLVVFVGSASLATFSAGNVGFRWKSPTAWKLDPGRVGALGPMLPELRGRTVLADESTAPILALMDSTVRVLAQRSQNTLTAFTAIGDRAEGDRRVRAQVVAAGLSDAPVYTEAFSQVLREDPGAVIVSTPTLWLIEPLLAQDGAKWTRSGGDQLLTLFTRNGD